MPPKKNNTKLKTDDTNKVKPTKPVKLTKKSKPDKSVEETPIETTDDIDYGDQEETQEELPEEDQDDTLDQPVPNLIPIDINQSLKERYEYKPVVQTEIVFLSDENRQTSEVLTKFEVTEIISIRAKQIENGGSCFTDVQDLTDPLEMAKKELLDKKCPLDVIRSITDKIYEKWHVNEMAIPSDF